MKSINLLMAINVLLSTSACTAQIKNATTEQVKIYGNCGMCETTIEKAGNVNKVAKVDWNKDSKMASITFDTKKTNKDEIMKRIALAGYDSDSFLAPDGAYTKLDACCQYDRVAKVDSKMEDKGKLAEMHTDHANHGDQKAAEKMEVHAVHADHQKMNMEHDKKMESSEKKAEDHQGNPLKAVFDTYFAVKDALVQTKANVASEKASALLTAIKEVKMREMEIDAHIAWMKILKNLTADAKFIAESKDVAKQRDRFSSLSTNIYTLVKIAPQDTPTYLQHCPMAMDGKGADWLSKENNVKNPYFGSMMLNCGKVVETIE